MELQQETLPPPAYENWMRWRFKMALEAVGDIKKHHRWSLSEPVCLVHNSKRTTKSRCIFSPRRVRLQELSQQEHQETFHHPALISLCPVFLTFIHFFFCQLTGLSLLLSHFFLWSTHVHTQGFCYITVFLPQRPREQSTADLRLDVRVNQAHMQGLGLSQNLSSLKTLHCPTLSLPTPHHSCGEPHGKLQAPIYWQF